MTGDVSTWSKTAGSNSSADPDINAAEGMAPSLVNDDIRIVMAAIANDRDDTRGALTTGGTTTAYTISTNGVVSAYFNGFKVAAKANATSTGSVTLNVDSRGSKKVYRQDSSGFTQLGSGDIVSGNYYEFVYNSALDAAAGGWIAVNAAFVIGTGAITSAMIANSTITSNDMASNSIVTAAITDANVTLAKLATDAYTTGTWTPAMSFGGSATGVTYATQSGSYIKIGNLVFIQGSINLTNNGSGVGTALITGLPFTATGTYNPGVPLTVLSGFSGLSSAPIGRVTPSGTTITLEMSGATSSAALTDTNVTNSASFNFSGFYST